ncbi:MAG TPA: amylo-alpha-1,6-glucosidase [Kofleriaceae bacterium]
MTLEWLEADGQGGFAMGAADGIRTRRYHALVCAACSPPDDRRVLVADLEVWLETDRGRFALSTHRYRGDVVYPEMSATFTYAPWPRWEWTFGDVVIAGELVVEPGAARVALQWTKLAGGTARLEVRPLLASRGYHELQRVHDSWRFDADVRGELVTWQPHDVPIVARSNGTYRHAPDWYRNFLYVDERDRGLDFEEDLAAPGVLAFDLAEPARLAFGLREAELDLDPWRRERARRAAFPSELARAASQYIACGRTVIAGYPWFGCWGRDTFISLRGLCLATGRRDVAGEILHAWATAISGGMLPNRFGDTDGVAEYNSVDAALWFVIAADAYGPDAELDTAIAAIVAGYAAGTRHRIAAAPDGLLACGEPGVQLTWMDAKIGDEVITPRIGKPVEVQALWLNALAIAGRRDRTWLELFERGRAAFVQRFWDPARGYLADVVDCDHVPGAIDTSLRPAQLFAIGGLPLQLIDGEPARSIVDTCERELWTPAGPRSLAPHDPKYRGRYAGGVDSRDRAYHQGTVWPWLAGTFVDAWLRVYGDRAAAHERFIAPLLACTTSAGLGHLPEVCDGDPPHRPGGCPFQAWSVAELLRLTSA